MTEYEVLCEKTLRNLEAFVRELRYQAAVGGSSSDAWRMLQYQEKELAKFRLQVIHTILDPDVARRIVHNEYL